jgi:ribosomal protein S27E
VSTKTFRNTYDLNRHGCTFDVKCLSCGHAASFSSAMLGDYCGPVVVNHEGGGGIIRTRGFRSDALSAIARRMRCSKCGGRRIDWWPKNRD